MSSPRIKDAAFLILAQAATKGFTFILNQLLLRRITPEIFGIAAYLEFINNTILFFSREAERLTIQRIKSDDPQNTHRAVVNFAYMPILLSWPILGLVYYIQKSSSLFVDTISKLPNFKWIIAILVSLIQIELLAEPLFSLNQFEMNLKIRSKAESLAVFMKCLVTFSVVLLLQNDSLNLISPVFAFALGHVAYSTTTYLQYWLNWSGSYPIISKLKNGCLLESSVVPMFRSLGVQMIFKHLLTEGDTLLVSYLFSVSEQGAYSVISNYGSLLARLLFQPIEETLRVSMTKLLANKDANPKSSYEFMEILIIFYANLCSLVVLGGYSNGSFMLRSILGNNKSWQTSEIFEAFPYYILYIPFMAFNGILEAFLSSASSHKQINQFSVFMSILSVAVLGLLYYLIGELRLGILGLVASNIVNMSLRIVYCCIFMTSFYQEAAYFKPRILLRRMIMPLISALSFLIVQFKVFGHVTTRSFQEFAISLCFCFLCLGVNIWNERSLLKYFIHSKRKLQ